MAISCLTADVHEDNNTISREVLNFLNIKANYSWVNVLF